MCQRSIYNVHIWSSNMAANVGSRAWLKLDFFLINPIHIY